MSTRSDAPADGDERRRAAALGISRALARKLADPDDVIRHARSLHPGSGHGGQASAGQQSLSSGLTGTALLFLGAAEPGVRDERTAHRHLRTVTSRLNRDLTRTAGIFSGLGGLGHALALAQRGTDGYTTALDAVDARVAVLTGALCADVRARPLGELGRFDVVSGLAGIGRYALLRGSAQRETLVTVLTALISLCRALPAGGGTVPGYWVLNRPRGAAVKDVRDGHLNLGLSHGIAGPLALLAAAHLADVSLPGQLRGIDYLAGIYRSRVVEDGHGPYWPNALSWDAWTTSGKPPTRPRSSWCYGTLGIARALGLAATATGGDELAELADAAVLAALRAPRGEAGITDAALCHGWAGALTCLAPYARRDGALGVEAARHRDAAAAALITGYDDAAPFGYRYPEADGHADLPGFLDGAAGISLALDAYGSRHRPAAPWQTTLFLA
ncbi:lanthionine synthetase C family protein [Streptomyces bacillaris]|uniref:lanthionine synthetase C family protein n=1 Tax=Streptomyces bacillaris TaxID=68179 RepID=UPI00369243C3